MTRILTILALCLSLNLLTGLAGLPAHAAGAPLGQQVSEQDAREAQKVVRAQLDAFAADYAEKAFSLATAAIRQMFGTSTQFIGMVRGSYPAVYRPAAVLFLKPEGAGGELVQPVHLTDQTGATWLALYRLQRQDDKSWRIGGCVLVPRAGKTA